jgi:hypothetical protein
MHWTPHLPEIFLGISLGMIAIEAALSRVAGGSSCALIAN